MILKTAVEPQRAQRNGRITRAYGIFRIHLLSDYSLFPFSLIYHDVFSVPSVVNAFLRLICFRAASTMCRVQEA